MSFFVISVNVIMLLKSSPFIINCSQGWGNIIMANVKALNCWSNTFIFISSDKNCHFIHQHYIKQRVYHIDLCWSRSQREIISKSPISSHPLHCRRLPQKALHIYAWCIFSTFLYFSPAALHIYTQSGCVCWIFLECAFFSPPIAATSPKKLFASTVWW